KQTGTFQNAQIANMAETRRLQEKSIDKPTIHTGTDELGRTYTYLFDPSNRKVTILNPDQGTATPGSPGVPTAPGTSTALTGEDYRAALRERNPAVASVVDRALQGLANPSNIPRQQRLAIIAHASAIEP